ncbi:ABC transporter permease [Paenibacillus motobuensis]|uniref:ABC transporter permease n=1 Tax=Paenibacillus motobuensis TaxID=295324 RepID=A0ABN0YK71_9BACL
MSMLSLEFYKLRRRRLFLMIALFLSVELAWIFLSTSISLSRNPDLAGWEGLIMTTASMNGLFLPILSAVVVSLICDMEHKGSTWKLLLSVSVTRGRIYAAKYLCASVLMLFAILLESAAIVGFGKMHQFQGSALLPLLMPFLGGAILTNQVVIALQQWLSLSIKNQAFSLCLGMIGGFIGMAAQLFPAMVRHLFVWSYYTELCPVTYDYANSIMRFVTRPIGFILPGILVIMGIVIYIIGRLQVSRQEV